MSTHIQRHALLSLPEPDALLDAGGLYARVYGRGEPLVLMHGNFGSGHGFAPILPALAGRFRVILPDLPGFGAHPPMDEITRNDPSVMVDYIARLMAALGLNSAVLGGHSLGGMAALLTALDRPALARALILLDSYVDIRERPAPLSRFGAFPGTAPETEAAIEAACDRSRQVAWHRAFDVSARLGELRVPVLEIMGEANPRTEADYRSFLLVKRSNLPLWTVVRAPRSGHFVHIEQPELVAREVLRFMEGI